MGGVTAHAPAASSLAATPYATAPTYQPPETAALYICHPGEHNTGDSSGHEVTFTDTGLIKTPAYDSGPGSLDMTLLIAPPQPWVPCLTCKQNCPSNSCLCPSNPDFKLPSMSLGTAPNPADVNHHPGPVCPASSHITRFLNFNYGGMTLDLVVKVSVFVLGALTLISLLIVQS